MSFENFTVYRREYETLQKIFPGFSEDRLDELLAAHSRWLGNRPEIANDDWIGPFLSGARTLHEKSHGLHESRISKAA